MISCAFVCPSQRACERACPVPRPLPDLSDCGLRFLNVLGEAGITAVEMDQIVHDNGKLACAHIRLDKQPDDTVLEKIRTGPPTIAGVELIEVA